MLEKFKDAGETRMEAEGGGVFPLTVTIAVEQALLTQADTVSVVADCGAWYSPALETVPLPLTDHAGAAVLPVTLAVNCWVCPNAIEPLVGLTVTTIPVDPELEG